jgi:glycine oxidase
MVLESNRYVIPRRDGRTLFGSTIEDVGFDKQTTKAARDELYRIATERFPILKQYPVEAHWAGLRPSSPAGVPFIGRHPQIDGLFINAGHFRNGIVLGPASARLLADLVLERPPILDPAPYAWTAARG